MKCNKSQNITLNIVNPVIFWGNFSDIVIENIMDKLYRKHKGIFK